MKLSVIIPAYNCESTLRSAVYSVCRQNYPDKEVIIIDDGSNDSTSSVILSLTKERNFILPIKTENKGPAFARNKGIEVSSGEYILFLDSDDEFSDDAFNVIFQALKDSPDILIFGFNQIFKNNSVKKTYAPEGKFNIDEYYKNNLLNGVWNKAYKSGFIKNNDIKFKNYRYGEDRLFNADVLLKNPSVKVIPDALYNYNIDGALSLVSKFIPDKFRSCKEIDSVFSRLLSDKTVRSRAFIKNILSCFVMFYSEDCFFDKKRKREEIKKILDDDSVKEAVSVSQDSLIYEIIRRILKTGDINLNVLLTKLIIYSKKNLFPIYLKIKG